MKSPILGTYKGAECVNCGHRYEESRECCPNCKEANEDYVHRSLRFAGQNSRAKIKIVEGILVKVEDEPIA